MKQIKLFLIAFAVFLAGPVLVGAASCQLTATSYNVSVGSKITVKLTTSGLDGRFDITSSDSKVFTGGGKVFVDRYTGTSASVTFTAKSAGSVVISAKPVDVTDNCGTKTIIVKSYVPRALSSDNYLASLSVEGVELIPSFDKDTDNYIVDLEPGTTSIKINAEKANKYASVNGTGEILVQEGSNELDVVVTAENGSKRTYHITAVVKEYDPINVKIGNSDFTVVRKSSELIKPEYYEPKSVQIGENTVPGFYSEKTGYTLVGLKDVTGAVKLYIYNNNEYKPYLSLDFNKMNLVIVEAPKSLIPVGFVKEEITINDEKITCYKNNELGITLIYGKSLITGNDGFYEYENTDLTIQKFNLNAYNLLIEKNTLYSYMILGLGGATLLILLCLIISIVNNKTKLKHRKTEIEKTMNIDINKIEKAAKKNKKIEKLKKQKEKELKKANLKKKETENKSKNSNDDIKNNEKDDNMFYL